MSVARHLRLAAAGLLIVACSDSAIAPTPHAGDPSLVEGATPLELAIDELSAAIFPKGLETASGTRWGNIKEKLAAGNVADARAKFAELSAWIYQKVPQMEDLGTGETSQHAATRLVFYMATFVYGTGGTVPDFSSGDVGFGVALPGEAITIVTANQTAGVALPAGAVSVPTVVVIAQNTTTYGECEGPLDTSLCQYPLYYAFDAYPHVRLNLPGRFGVCDESASAHDNLRLAHDLPADPANYSAGATQVEGIEILKPVSASDFLECDAEHEDVATAARERTSRLGRAWTAVATAARRALAHVAPRPAFAAMRRIDQGVGGEGSFFSNFNSVDPTSPRSTTIDFETYPDGTPTCAVCNLTEDYASQGVVFSHAPFGIEEPTYLTLATSSNNPEGIASNHEASQPRMESGGNYGGDIVMDFTGYPRSVVFEVRVNATATDVPVTAYELAIDHTTDTPPLASVSRTSSTYTLPVSGVQFRQERITVTSTVGITRIRLGGMIPVANATHSTAYLLLVDDITITP